ncbi:hypothetical protein [Blastomonas sp. AAP53]|uniref:hypothetical protein n=1 Tax=Blastomonas sp. AAP53 TaxID=1248760 RepID=UPI0002DE7DCC|nr:hypothetical protein [Blastomonas sp. AAP53]
MHLFKEEAYISRIYFESMRDNFEGYAWDLHPDSKAEQASNEQKTAQLNALRKEFEDLDPLSGNSPTLGQLFKIELALVWLIPEAALRARFWTIEDRFHRVVPTSVARSYQSSFSAQSVDEVTEEVLRQRARNLLDVIHANYLINLARENSIKRMMTILAFTAFVIVSGSLGFISMSSVIAAHGLVAIMVAGMFGAMISLIQRLQKATSRDAMVEDGIYELIGLRVGWVSVLMSIGIGGVFALFIYVLVSGNLLDQLVPHVPSPEDPAGGAGGGGIDGLALADDQEDRPPDARLTDLTKVTDTEVAGPVQAPPQPLLSSRGAPATCPRSVPKRRACGWTRSRMPWA